MPANRNAIGSRGEAIVATLLTRFHGREWPLFRPLLMGEKYPTVDLFVEVVDAPGDQIPFFLAQVKATQAGYSKSGRTLKVRVRREGMGELIRYPAPTYVIGVDEPRELGFILGAVSGGPHQLSTFKTSYPLADPGTLQALYDEVLEYWASSPARFTTSRFA